jgi:poly-gamma-glutamate capsule biosynthesis protein CapA/YwtB (metallophosphatase superfamily)
MDTKSIISNVLTAVLTTAVLGIGAYVMGVFEKGSEAISEDQIIRVIDATLVTASGKKLRARIAEVDQQLVALETRADRLEKDLDEAERSILCLAGGC